MAAEATGAKHIAHEESNHLPNFRPSSTGPITHHPLPFVHLTTGGATRSATTTARAMASSKMYLFLPFFLFSIIFISSPVKCDENDALLQGINNYRKSLNLSALTKNNNAACLAGEMTNQFEDQPCTNTTGSNTVPGTEPQFSNYPSLLDHCHLNITNTRDGMVMPACVPKPTPSLVLANFTESQYSQYLNDTKYTGAGMSSDGDWVVVVLTTSTPEGSFVTYNAATSGAKIGLIAYFLWSLTGFFVFLVE